MRIRNTLTTSALLVVLAAMLVGCGDLRNHRAMRATLDEVRDDVTVGMTATDLKATLAERHPTVELIDGGDFYEARLEGDPEDTGSNSICWMRLQMADDGNGGRTVTEVKNIECPA
ncbi:MAG: hypothetical protein AAGD35_16815 [Actinomycetota bacterium]